MATTQCSAAAPLGEPLVDLLRRWGWDTTSFQVLQPGFRHRHTDRGGCVSYVDTGGAWVAAGSPLTSPLDLKADALEFSQAAANAGRRVVFAGVEPPFVEHVAMRALLIGRQPLLDPGAWPATLQHAPRLREQLRRARGKGVVVRGLSSQRLAATHDVERRAVDDLVQGWLRARSLPPLGFLVGTTPFSLPSERRFFGAWHGGRLVAFASLAPVYTRHGWLLEHLFRLPNAPNGTNELLVDAALCCARGLGSEFVSLGLAPLSGPVPPWLRRLGRLSRGLYDCAGLERFKAKFRPSRWTPVYLCFPERQSALSAVYDSLTAVAGQPLSRFGLSALGSALQAR